MVVRPTLRQRLLLAWGASTLLMAGVLGVVFTVLLTGLHMDRARSDIGIAFDLLAGQLRNDHRSVLADARMLAERDDVVGALHLVSSFEDPGAYAPYVFDVEKRHLAEEFAQLAGGKGPDEVITARDAGLTLVAFFAGGGGVRDPQAGFLTVIGGSRVPVGMAQPLDDLVRIVDLPAAVEALAPTALPDAAAIRHRLYDGRLYHEAVAPVVRRLPDGRASVVGAITVARALAPRTVEEVAIRTGLDIALVPGGTPVPAPFAGADLSAVDEPLLSEADLAAPATAGQEVASPDYFLRAAWLPLDDGRLYIVIARKRSDLDAGLAAFGRATLLALAGCAVLFVPLGAWVLRRSLSHPLERLAAAAEALRHGRFTTIDAGGPDDEVSRVAAAFNRMAAGVAAREAQLRAGLERYRDLYETAPVAFVSVRAEDGRILRYNRAFEALLGFDGDDLGRLRIVDLYADTPYGKAAAHRIYARFRKGEAVHDAELQMRRRDGRPMWVSVSTEPVRDAAGQVVEGRSVLFDIDARKGGGGAATADAAPLNDR